MRIVFLCGSLEPGRDGVGDYVRRIAIALTGKGHVVAAIALYDSYVTFTTEYLEEASDGNFQVVRIPSAYKAKCRFDVATGFTKKFNAQWLTLQYVGFGFNRYGLPWDIILFLKRVIGKAKLHIMLHELWCGMPAKIGRKEKLLGSIQKKFLPIMLHKLRPQSVSTSNLFYASELNRIKIDCNVLPIFGNIPLDDLGNDEDWNTIVNNTLLVPLITQPAHWVVLGFFGAIYTCPGLEKLIYTASEAADKMGLKFGLLAFGYNGEKDITAFVKDITDVTCWQTGPLPSAMINRVLHLVNAGIITTPADRITKSGSAMALLERGIPVLVSSKDDTYNKAGMVVDGIYQINTIDDVQDGISAKGKLSTGSRLLQVAKFYSDLALNMN